MGIWGRIKYNVPENLCKQNFLGKQIVALSNEGNKMFVNYT